MPAKVSQFPIAARPLTGAELFGVAQGGINAKVSGLEYYTDIVQPAIVNLQNQINALVAGSGLLPMETVSTPTYTLDSNDAYIAFELTYAGPVVITVPLDSAQPIPIGARARFCDVFGAATIVPQPGVTIVSWNNSTTSAGPNAIFELHKVRLNKWWVLGDVL